MNIIQRDNTKGWVYVLSQPSFRELLQVHYKDNVSEEFVKYAYDNYTHQLGMKPIRKKKIRSKIQAEFHKKGLSKKDAHYWSNKLINITRIRN